MIRFPAVRFATRKSAPLGLGRLPSAQVGIPFLLGADLVLTALPLLDRRGVAVDRRVLHPFLAGIAATGLVQAIVALGRG